MLMREGRISKLRKKKKVFSMKSLPGVFGN